MVSNRLGKVQKHVAKKKGKNVASLHENSRDTKRIQSAALRDQKLNRVTALREKQNKSYILRIKSFQSYTAEHTTALPLATIQSMIEDYLGRDDDLLASLQSERRAGRPPSTRETQLQQQRATEQAEYASGFWVPDLENEETLKKLKDWDGRWSGLATMGFVRISKEGVKRESCFPPKGLS
ncbi:hypothetical protein DM02DRAFT_542511 [Periconia macrospinosa]|uniref:Translation machinery-associated protein 16 n=1 Tax=Periconia macrospinosa TaxID=97972 RepID=A0A2V1D4L1_9PLEO|nr:hypothetical protein DM02DRAFT_542511 [Periconia macrospinosa]